MQETKMAPESLEALLTTLEAAKRQFDTESADRVLALLAQLAPQAFPDAPSLIRFHEALLFLRVYPHNPEVLERSEALLASFNDRVATQRASDADAEQFDSEEDSGIAGSATDEVFSYDVLRRLLVRHPGKLRVIWDEYEEPSRMATTWPRFIPLLEEDSLVEANVPYAAWLDAARDDTGELQWLVQHFESLPVSLQERAELYDSLSIPVRWELENSPATRTRNRRPCTQIFYQHEPLLRRQDVSLAHELTQPEIPVEKLSRADGEPLLDMAREGMAVRHRELYAFTHGGADNVLAAHVGRGVEIFLCGLPAGRRLPWRAYHGFLVYKNGVQVGYGDLVSFFDRGEVAFNHYSTFREGESAWIYARLLRLLQQVFGISCFTVDPYQIGYHNDEAIQSGAFWFYRKLGFRPLRPELRRLVEKEEEKIRATPGYRTPARTLRRIASGHVVWELPGSSTGAWDNFNIRKLAHDALRLAATAGDLNQSVKRSAEALAAALGLDYASRTAVEKTALANFGLLLAVTPGLQDWTTAETAALAEIIRAKVGPDEIAYVRHLQRHACLRSAVLKAGSMPPVQRKRARPSAPSTL
jgi:hypothetical protein